MLDINMPRGDIRSLTIAIRDHDGEITEIEFDDIFFTVKTVYQNKEFIFQKKLSNGTIEKLEDGTYFLSIMPEDTNDLQFGQYSFDIEILKGTTIKQTTVGRLCLTPEVTYQINEV